MPVGRACSIIKQVAAGLEAAHRLGMIHRDIKPDNIVLIETASGEEAKVLDFGIAKLKESRAGGTGGLTLTGTGVVIGTPQYMSPEQAMGKRGDDLDGRSDLYSLGVVMYQMLTGDLPFKADTTMEMLLAHLQKPPTPINILRPELQIPESVATLVMKTLEKDRELRPASARVLIQEIERAESGPEPLGRTRLVQPTSVYTPRPAEELRAAMQAKRAQAEQSAAPPTMPVASMESPRTEAPTAATSPSGPVAAAPPAPVARPAPAQRPRPAPAVARPEGKSRWGIWASIAILLVGIGGVGWYFASRQPAGSAPSQETTSPPVSGPAEPKPPTSGEAAVSQPQEGTTAPAAQEVKQVEPASEPEQTSTIPPAATRATPTRQQRAKEKVRQLMNQPARSEPAVNPLAARPSPLSTTAQPARVLPPQPTTVDPKQISAAITLGNFYLDHGDYDKAIAEFQKGLRLDPSNPTLRESFRRAQRAKAAEERILQ